MLSCWRIESAQCHRKQCVLEEENSITELVALPFLSDVVLPRVMHSISARSRAYIRLPKC